MLTFVALVILCSFLTASHATSQTAANAVHFLLNETSLVSTITSDPSVASVCFDVILTRRWGHVSSHRHEGTATLKITLNTNPYFQVQELVHLSINYRQGIIGTNKQVVVYEKELHFCETHTEHICFDIKVNYDITLTMAIRGGGSAHVANYLIIDSTGKVMFVDYGALHDLYNLRQQYDIKEIDVSTLYSNKRVRLIDTTCITDGQISAIICIFLVKFDISYIFLREYNTIYVVEVKSSDTVGTVKEKLYAKQGIYPEVQRLVFRQQQLDDTLSLQHYNICVVDVGTRHSREFRNSDLELYLRKVSIMNSVHERNANVMVRKTDTIAVIKAKLEKISKIPTELQIVKYGDTILENEHSLTFYGISSSNPFLTLHEINSTVKVDYWCGNTSITISASDTFKVINKKIQDKVGLPASAHVWINKTEETKWTDSLPRIRLNFPDCFEIPIRFSDSTVKNTKVEVEIERKTVKEVKQQISEKTQIPFEDITLKTIYSQMNDENEFSSYNLDDMIYADIRQRYNKAY